MKQFDKLVLTILALLTLTLLAMVWIGGRLGVPVADLVPAAGAQQVSTQADIRIRFDQPMDSTAVPTFTLSPVVSGTTRWEGQTLVFSPATPLAPNSLYQVILAAGLPSQQGRLSKEISWQFQTGSPRVIYIAWDSERQGNQLYAVTTDGGEPTALTTEETNVLDYGVAPNGQTIAYTVSRSSDGGSDIWLIDADGSDRHLLLDCPDGACSRPTWAPDGQRLIYERRSFAGAGGPPGPPRLWWYDLVAEDTLAVFSDTQWLGYGVSFSPDGRWISYVAPNTQGIEVYNLETAQNLFVLSRTGEQAAWSPTNNELLLTQLQLETAEFAIQIVRANLETEEVTNVSGDEPSNDSWPTYAPHGEWVAFTRQAAGSVGGKQLWLMRPDGSDAYALTDNLDAHHGAPQWSPDGRFLAVQRFLLSAPENMGIWLLDVETQEIRELAVPGVSPNWLP
ncbi:MAG: Ig-like domain-containing protein [Chloroflexota bacterium]